MSAESFLKNAAFGFMDSAALGLIPDRWGPSQVTSSGEWGRLTGDLLGLAVPYAGFGFAAKAGKYVDKIRKAGEMGGKFFSVPGRALEKTGMKKIGGRISAWDKNIKDKIINSLGTQEAPGMSHYLLKEAYEGAVVGGLYGAGTEIGNTWGSPTASAMDMIFNPIGGAVTGAAFGGLAGAAFGSAIGGYKGYRNSGVSAPTTSLADPMDLLPPANVRGYLPDPRLLPAAKQQLPPSPFVR